MCHSFTIASYQELERVLRELSQESGFSSRFTISQRIKGEEEEPVESAAPKDEASAGASEEGVLPAGGASDAKVVARKAVAYPGTYAPVILAGEAEGSEGQPPLFELRADMFGFGWPVEWKKGTVFNARIDSLMRSGGMWGDALMTRRCVVPCDSFFESHRSETSISKRTGKPIKRRYVFSSPDDGMLLLAAVYEEDHFSIVTTDADPQVSSIHDRMPLVLDEEDAAAWLDPASTMDRLCEIAGVVNSSDDELERLHIEPVDGEATAASKPAEGDEPSQQSLF